MNSEFLQELQDSLYVHRPLPLHPERSLGTGNFPAAQLQRTQ